MAIKTELTDFAIRHLRRPHAGTDYHPDSKIPGFGIRVTQTGIKTFYFLYRFGSHRPRLNLGNYPGISLAQARKQAEIARGFLRRGLNPAIHLDVEDNLPHATDEAALAALQAPIFSIALQDYIAKHLVSHCSESTRKEVTSSLRASFLQAWANIPIDQITTDQIIKILDSKIEDGKPSSANHALSYIKAFFNWYVARKVIKASPARTIPKPAATVRRSRHLTGPEIRAIWLAAEVEINPIGKLVQLALVTGQRRGEIAGMRWDELFFDNGYWAIPGSRTKNGKDHVVPLSFLAKDILGTIAVTPLPMQPGDRQISYSPYVFPAPRAPDKPVTNFTDTKARLEQLANIAPWCIHDLRRTVATGLGDFSILPKVKKKIFNHSENEVHDIYDRFEYFKERCHALHQWAEYIEKAVSGSVKTSSSATFVNPYDKRGDADEQREAAT